jgi:hypothetical protein
MLECNSGRKCIERHHARQTKGQDYRRGDGAPPRGVRQADAGNRIEGRFPTPGTTAINEEFIRGEIELDDIWTRVQVLTRAH